jgi:biotin carboxylase
MAHLLILDLSAGSDTDILDAARSRSDSFVFLSGDLAHYRSLPSVWAALADATERIDVPGFDDAEVRAQVSRSHAARPFDAVLCLNELRLIEAARLAEMLGLAYLNVASARLLRDKAAVRRRLAERGIAQPDFVSAETAPDVAIATRRLGFPVLVKPADGMASQAIAVLRDDDDLDGWLRHRAIFADQGAPYGLGVEASRRWLVERYLPGTLIGCDTLTVGGRHMLVGVHHKRMFRPPSFTMPGSTFIAAGSSSDDRAMALYVETLLDAVGFDWGAAHIEIMLTAEGPRPIEINPRLVGAGIARLTSLGIGRSLHSDLIDLHLRRPVPPVDPRRTRVASIRWVVARAPGRLTQMRLPQSIDPCICEVRMRKQVGDTVRLPFANSDRLASVMAVAASRGEAEQAAQAFVDAVELEIEAVTAPAAEPEHAA